MRKHAGIILFMVSILCLARTAFLHEKTDICSKTQAAAAEPFFMKTGERGVIHSGMKMFFAWLREDVVFQDGTMELTGLVIEDMDGNGQKDMLAMLMPRAGKESNDSGCIWLYMNEDEPYCFDEPECFYDGQFDFFAEDIDNDGNVEIVLSMEGSGCGGAGDFYKVILKYRNDGAHHQIERMELPSDLWDGFTDQGIVVSVYQEAEKKLYSAYCSYFREIIYFEAENAAEPKEAPVWVGGNERGFFDLRAVEYQGQNALQASEYLYGEGGSAHEVATARFLILWDKDGNGYVEKWWLDSVRPESAG